MTTVPAVPPTRRATWTRRIGIAAALIAGGIYLLIGVDTLSIGEPATEAATDLFAFGVVMAAFSLLSAIGLERLHGRLGLALVAAVQLVPLIGYLAFFSMREPPFELWGVLIKVAQVTVLAAAALLAAWAHPASVPATTQTKGAPA